MRAAVANDSQVSRRKRSMALSPMTRALSARKRSNDPATSGATRYSGLGSSLAFDAKNARSTFSSHEIARRTRIGRWASRISAETSRSSSRQRAETATARQVPTPTRMPGGTE